MFWFGDWTFVVLIPAIIFSLYAQWKVGATFRRYSQIFTSRGLTGAAVARAIVQGYGALAGTDPQVAMQTRQALSAVAIEATPGELTDHYDPRQRVLRLSEPVYGNTSIAAISVAAHEAGHALQHATAYPFLAIRSLVAPVANFGSMLSFPILLFGMFVPSFFPQAINIAILLYSVVVAFTVITLPVEFNASRRAMLVLEQGGFMSHDELRGARAMLNAAALTYVAATASALLTLLRLILLREERR